MDRKALMRLAIDAVGAVGSAAFGPGGLYPCFDRQGDALKAPLRQGGRTHSFLHGSRCEESTTT